MSNLSLFESNLSDPFDVVFRRMMAPFRSERAGGDIDIRVDVTEKDGHFKVRADLPGVKKDNINVRVDGNLVQIDAQTADEMETKDADGKVWRSERHYGSVSRAFTLATDVDDTKAVAKYEDGVLTLDLPKKTGGSSHRIAVK